MTVKAPRIYQFFSLKSIILSFNLTPNLYYKPKYTYEVYFRVKKIIHCKIFGLPSGGAVVSRKTHFVRYATASRQAGLGGPSGSRTHDLSMPWICFTTRLWAHLKNILPQ